MSPLSTTLVQPLLAEAAQTAVSDGACLDDSGHALAPEDTSAALARSSTCSMVI
jgi:hypothetical protein